MKQCFRCQINKSLWFYAADKWLKMLPKDAPKYIRDQSSTLDANGGAMSAARSTNWISGGERVGKGNAWKGEKYGKGNVVDDLPYRHHINVRSENGQWSQKHKIVYLLAYKWHDADTSENVLTWESLARNAVSECLGIVSTRLAEMPHEQRHVRLELTLTLATKISHQPVYVTTAHTHRER